MSKYEYATVAEVYVCRNSVNVSEPLTASTLVFSGTCRSVILTKLSDSPVPASF
jgi:hypothetical protein